MCCCCCRGGRGAGALRLPLQAQQVLLQRGVLRQPQAREHCHDGGGRVEEEAERPADQPQPGAPE